MAKKINVKLILELRGNGMGRNAIARTRHISVNSVGDVFHKADEHGISYEDVRDMDEDSVYRMFYPDKFVQESMYARPDYGYVHQELKRVGVTLKLLWQEYQDRCRAAGSIPMGYTKYCKGYSDYTIVNRLTNHLEHKPGDAVEVDWSGPVMEYVDTATGEAVKVYLFVATLPYSQYSYVEPCRDMKMDSFIRAHVHMYQYFGGVATRLICDNLKTGVVSHPREGEIVLTADYEALGSHYQTAIMPAGIRKPKQKASVEGTVGKVATAVIARLRNEMFCSFEELKAAVLRKLEAFNHGSFQKREGSRYEAYPDEKPFLHPLPSIPYEIATWVYGRKNQYSTHQEDMPDKFRISPWDDVRIRNWAGAIGKYTAEVVGRIFEGVSIKEQGYNPALAVLRLSNKYSEARLEAACEFAVTNGIKKPRYHHLSSILAANQDEIYMEQKKASDRAKTPMGYLRGSDYYGGGRNDQ